MPRRRAGNADEAPSAPCPRKRKSTHSYGALSPPADSMGDLATAEARGDGGPDRKTSKAAARVLDSLETGDVSEADSWSGAPIAEYDFVPIRSKRGGLPARKCDAALGMDARESMFEHQVLKEGVHREPTDFSLRLEDVVKISWNLEALRVYLVMSDQKTCFKDDKLRGNIMVAFKRETTMRRFIMFCRREEIELVEKT